MDRILEALGGEMLKRLQSGKRITSQNAAGCFCVASKVPDLKYSQLLLAESETTMLRLPEEVRLGAAISLVSVFPALPLATALQPSPPTPSREGGAGFKYTLSRDLVQLILSVLKRQVPAITANSLVSVTKSISMLATTMVIERQLLERLEEAAILQLRNMSVFEISGVYQSFSLMEYAVSEAFVGEMSSQIISRTSYLQPATLAAMTRAMSWQRNFNAPKRPLLEFLEKWAITLAKANALEMNSYIYTLYAFSQVDYNVSRELLEVFAEGMECLGSIVDSQGLIALTSALARQSEESVPQRMLDFVKRQGQQILGAKRMSLAQATNYICYAASLELSISRQAIASFCSNLLTAGPFDSLTQHGTIINSLAKLTSNSPDLTAAMPPALQPLMRAEYLRLCSATSPTTKHAVNFLRDYIKLGWEVDQELLDEVMGGIRALEESFSPPLLLPLLMDLGRLGERGLLVPKEGLEYLEQQAAVVLEQEVNGAEMSGILLGFARAGHVASKEFMEVICHSLLQVTNFQRSFQLSSLLWSLTRIRGSYRVPQPPLQHLQDLAIQLSTSNNLSTLDYSRLLTSFSLLNLDPSRAFIFTLCKGISDLPSLHHASTIARILVALGKLTPDPAQVPESTLKKLEDEYLKLAAEQPVLPDSHCLIAYGFATMQHRVSPRYLAQLSESLLAVGVIRNSWDLAYLTWSLGKFQKNAGSGESIMAVGGVRDLLALLEKGCIYYATSYGLESQKYSCFFSGFAALDFPVSAEFMAAMEEAMLKKPAQDSVHLAISVMGMSRLEPHAAPSQRLLAWCEEEVIRFVEGRRMSYLSFRNILNGFTDLRYSVGEKFVAMAEGYIAKKEASSRQDGGDLRRALKKLLSFAAIQLDPDVFQS